MSLFTINDMPMVFCLPSASDAERKHAKNELPCAFFGFSLFPLVLDWLFVFRSSSVRGSLGCWSDGFMQGTHFAGVDLPLR